MFTRELTKTIHYFITLCYSVTYVEQSVISHCIECNFQNENHQCTKYQAIYIERTLATQKCIQPTYPKRHQRISN